MKKRTGFGIALDIFMTLITSGLWLVWVLVRTLIRKTDTIIHPNL